MLFWGAVIGAVAPIVIDKVFGGSKGSGGAQQVQPAQQGGGGLVGQLNAILDFVMGLFDRLFGAQRQQAANHALCQCFQPALQSPMQGGGAPGLFGGPEAR